MFMRETPQCAHHLRPPRGAKVGMRWPGGLGPLRCTGRIPDEAGVILRSVRETKDFAETT
jgi:hypothetical protein